MWKHDDTLRQANYALDAANFFLADVRDALGPYLAIYLLTERRWDEASIGVVMSIATLAGIFAQTPAGALVDATRAKRAVMVGAAVLVTAASLLVGAKADEWGRKPLFLAALGILPIRGALYTLSDNLYWLVGVQLLDGIGAGIYGALFPVIVADLMRGTGRFNVAQGAVSTAQGIGAALSTAIAGLIVVQAGYGPAFLALGAVAAAGFVLFLLAMPETRTGRVAVRPLAL